MKNLKTSKVPKLKFERFLKYMLCVLRPAEAATYENVISLLLSSTIGDTTPLVFAGFHQKISKISKI